MATESTNLYQRLAAVAKELGPIKPTGKNEFKAPALSIGDVEEKVGPLLAKHGIVTRWSYGELEKLDNRLWKAWLKVELVNADDPKDAVMDDWADIGSNPMAATSFARKGYYKALFHIADDDDATDLNRIKPDFIVKHDAAPARLKPETVLENVDDERVCPHCGKSEALMRKHEDPERAFCASSKGGCGKSFPAKKVLTRQEFLEIKRALDVTQGRLVDPELPLRVVGEEEDK